MVWRGFLFSFLFWVNSRLLPEIKIVSFLQRFACFFPQLFHLLSHLFPFCVSSDWLQTMASMELFTFSSVGLLLFFCFNWMEVFYGPLRQVDVTIFCIKEAMYLVQITCLWIISFITFKINNYQINFLYAFGLFRLYIKR